MDITHVFYGIGVAVTSIVIVGAAIALLRGSYTKARVEALQGDNKDLRSKVQDLRDSVTDLEHKSEKDALEKTALSERVSHVENENSLLKQLVTQRADVESLKSLMELHHNAAMENDQLMLDEIKKLSPVEPK